MKDVTKTETINPPTSSVKSGSASQGVSKSKGKSKPKPKKEKLPFKHDSSDGIFPPVLEDYRKPNYLKYNDCKDQMLSRLRTGKYPAKTIAEEAEISHNSTFFKYHSMLNKESDLLLLTKEEYEYIKKNKTPDEMEKINSQIKEQNIGFKEPPFIEKPKPLTEHEQYRLENSTLAIPEPVSQDIQNAALNFAEPVNHDTRNIASEQQ